MFDLAMFVVFAGPKKSARPQALAVPR